nr:MAG TPA: hypothetical protein [Caudoviricetes sp.]
MLFLRIDTRRNKPSFYEYIYSYCYSNKKPNKAKIRVHMN